MTEPSSAEVYQAGFVRLAALAKAKSLTYTVYAFGCQQNESDGEKMRGILQTAGFTEASGFADVILINSCAIRAHAEDKVFSLIGTLAKKKRTEKPQTVIGLVGCMAAEKENILRLKRSVPEISFSLEPGALHLLPDLIADALEGGANAYIFGDALPPITENIPTAYSSSFRAFVPIMYGCNNFCTYCIVPYVRGRERSRASADILAECRNLIDRGYKEITLLGQNVNSYHSDVDFATLCEKICDIPGDFRLLFMTSHPKDVSDALVDALAEHGDKLAPYFHLPMQSGSSAILKKMNRTYDREGYRATANRLRSVNPNMALSTDVIVGFPGESEADFEETLSLLEEISFDLVYPFLYSPRIGTPASKMEQIPEEVKASRMERLIPLCDRMSLERNRLFLGKTLRVLAEGNSRRNPGMMQGRSDEAKIVHYEPKTKQIGQFVSVFITDADASALTGKEI